MPRFFFLAFFYYFTLRITVKINTLPMKKIASLKNFSNQLLVCFGGTSNEARLWLIDLYQSYLEHPTNFTLLCVDNWQGTLGAYRADIAADLRDELPDRLIVQFLQNVFYYSGDTRQNCVLTPELKALISQLKQDRNLEEKIIVILANESYNVAIAD
jgi:hypothetical protein